MRARKEEKKCWEKKVMVCLSVSPAVFGQRESLSDPSECQQLDDPRSVVNISVHHLQDNVDIL